MKKISPDIEQNASAVVLLNASKSVFACFISN